MSHEGPRSFVPQEAVTAPVKKESPLTKEDSWKKMQEWIAELQATSKFSREKTPDGREKIRNPEGEEFFIRRVTDPKDPKVKEIHKFLAKEFTEEEADTLDTIKGAVSVDYQAYHTLERGGKVVALANTAYLELEAQAGKKGPAESIIFDAYIVTDQKYRGRGLAGELYQKTFQHTLEMARAKGTMIKGIIAEAVSTVESFMNKLGSRRMYFEDGQGNFREVPYIQAPLDWDPKTGKALVDVTPEHLMIRLVDGRKELRVEGLIRMVSAIYGENYVFPEDFFKSEKAFANCENTVAGHLEKLKKALSQAKDSRLILLSKDEREQKKRELTAKGKKLIEYKTDGK